MQTKHQAPNAKISTPAVKAKKVEPREQPQPLDLKTIQRVGGGRGLGLPGGSW